MGIQDSGPFGGFRGKTGPLVGRRVKGKNVITGLHYTSNKPATELQLQQQERFAMLNGILLKIRVLVKVGFASYAKRNTTLNAAYTYNYERVYAPESLAESLDFSKLMYSRGDVATPNCASAVSLMNSGVSFSWLAEAESQYSRVNDLATFMIYHEETGMAVGMQNVVSRGALGYILNLPEAMQTGMRHCYMSFVSEDRKLVGDSVYVGKV